MWGPLFRLHQGEILRLLVLVWSDTWFNAWGIQETGSPCWNYAFQRWCRARTAVFGPFGLEQVSGRYLYSPQCVPFKIQPEIWLDVRSLQLHNSQNTGRHFDGHARYCNTNLRNIQSAKKRKFKGPSLGQNEDACCSVTGYKLIAQLLNTKHILMPFIMDPFGQWGPVTKCMLSCTPNVVIYGLDKWGRNKVTWTSNAIGSWKVCTHHMQCWSVQTKDGGILIRVNCLEIHVQHRPTIVGK